MDNINNLLYVALGWLIGVLGQTISEKIKKQYMKKELLAGFLSELVEKRYRLASQVYILQTNSGALDHELIKWTISNMENYEGSYAEEINLDNIKDLLTKPEKDLAAHSKAQAKELERRPDLLNKFDLLFLESNFTAISLFDRQFQLRIIEIISRFKALNSQIDRSNFFYEKTFDSSITGPNYAIVERNLQEGQQRIILISKRIVSSINYLYINRNKNSQFVIWLKQHLTCCK